MARLLALVVVVNSTRRIRGQEHTDFARAGIGTEMSRRREERDVGRFRSED
jgi:hypothetical protein